MTEYIGREEKCGDCIHVEVCERNPILTEFSRENPACCKKFMKAADVAPVRYGRWIDKGGYAVCTECGGRSGIQYDGVEPIPLMTQFCPNCGAKMDGGAD